MRVKRVAAGSLIALALLLTACGGAAKLAEPSEDDLSLSAAEINAAAERASVVEAEEGVAGVAEPVAGPADPAQDEAPLINPRVPVPEDLRVNWLIPPDGIRPIYDPKFAPAGEAPLSDEELVIGVSLEGEAKAYPITVLRSREMVNDEMGGIPTLVTW
jgi:hypothetical protein